MILILGFLGFWLLMQVISITFLLYCSTFQPEALLRLVYMIPTYIKECNNYQWTKNWIFFFEELAENTSFKVVIFPFFYLYQLNFMTVIFSLYIIHSILEYLWKLTFTYLITRLHSCTSFNPVLRTSTLILLLLSTI